MRIQAIELRDKDRINLWEHFPLDKPLVMYIEPTNLCNYRCAFCPTGNPDLIANRPTGTMSFETLRRIVEGFDFDGKVRRINMYKDGEPLVTKLFPAMVRYLKQAAIADELWVKTNGALLKPALNEELAHCGLDMIGLSIVGMSASQVESVAHARINWTSYVDNIADLYQRTRGKCKVYAKLANSGMSAEAINAFYKTFEPISDYCAVEGLHGWSNSDVRDFKMGTDNSFEGGEKVRKVVCPLALCAMTINWNGNVGPCNEDWMHAHIFGNVNTRALSWIWEGEARREFLRMHLEGRRAESVVCGECDYMYCLPDNVDDHRLEMLAKL